MKFPCWLLCARCLARFFMVELLGMLRRDIECFCGMLSVWVDTLLGILCTRLKGGF